jgi:hypothetical protein
MSTIAERARAEAEEAEQENPDAEPVEPIEPDEDEAQEEESAPEPPPVTEATFRKLGESIAKEDARHEKRLREIYGDLWGERDTCPLCLQEGFVIPAEPGQFDPEQRDAVLSVMGEGGPTEAATHQSKVRCEQCDGWGQLYTGSRNEAYKYDACLFCNGSGTVDKSVLASAQAQPLEPSAVYFPPPAPDPASVNRDQWGRPMGHERYGVDPQYNGGMW